MPGFAEYNWGFHTNQLLYLNEPKETSIDYFGLNLRVKIKRIPHVN